MLPCAADNQLELTGLTWVAYFCEYVFMLRKRILLEYASAQGERKAGEYALA